MSECSDYETASGLILNWQCGIHLFTKDMTVQLLRTKRVYPETQHLVVPLPSIHVQPEETSQMKYESHRAEVSCPS